MVLGQLPLRKIAPNPKTNPYPNSNMYREAIFRIRTYNLLRKYFIIKNVLNSFAFRSPIVVYTSYLLALCCLLLTKSSASLHFFVYMLTDPLVEVFIQEFSFFPWSLTIFCQSLNTTGSSPFVLLGSFGGHS